MPQPQDRKDPPLATSTPVVPETPADRDQRKAHESELLDEAITETFPASDPVSPFVPAPGVVLDGDDVENIRAESPADVDTTSDDAPTDVENIDGELPDDVEGSSIEDYDLEDSAEAAVRGREDVEGISDSIGAGVEQAMNSPPDPIDPGGGNRPVI